MCRDAHSPDRDFDVVLAWHLDRVSRNDILDAAEWLRPLRKTIDTFWSALALKIGVGFPSSKRSEVPKKVPPIGTVPYRLQRNHSD
jgi:hypothetical protein